MRFDLLLISVPPLSTTGSRRCRSGDRDPVSTPKEEEV